jgi:hypothetical protein
MLRKITQFSHGVKHPSRSQKRNIREREREREREGIVAFRFSRNTNQ